MTNKEYLKDIANKINKMNSNSFLLPESWSDIIDMDLHDWSYRTYCSRTNNLYIIIDIYSDTKNIHSFTFRSEGIEVTSSLGNNINSKILHEYVDAIYQEKHSFSEYDAGLKSIRAKIREERNNIKNATEKIKLLQLDIEGLKTLKDGNEKL